MWVQCLLRQSEWLRPRGSRTRVAVRFQHDPAELLSALAAGELPDLPEVAESFVVVDVSTTAPDAHEPAWA